MNAKGKTQSQCTQAKNAAANRQEQQAIAAGGIGTLLELTKRLDLRKEINRAIPLFKLHLPYDEADHVFNIAMNLLAGGNCLEHIEDRRQNENVHGAMQIWVGYLLVHKGELSPAPQSGQPQFADVDSKASPLQPCRYFRSLA